MDIFIFFYIYIYIYTYISLSTSLHLSLFLSLSLYLYVHVHCLPEILMKKHTSGQISNSSRCAAPPWLIAALQKLTAGSCTDSSCGSAPAGGWEGPGGPCTRKGWWWLDLNQNLAVEPQLFRTLLPEIGTLTTKYWDLTTKHWDSNQQNGFTMVSRANMKVEVLLSFSIM